MNNLLEIAKAICNKAFNTRDNRNKNIKSNIIGSLALKGFSIIIQLLFVPLTLQYLNSNVYGIWLTVSSVVLWISFFDIGFTQGLKNKLTEALAENNIIRGKELVSTTYIILCAIFIPLCIICEIFTPFINWSAFLHVSSIFNNQLIDVVHILILCLCTQMIVSTIGSVLSSYQKVAIASSFPVIGNFFSLIIIVVLIETTVPSMFYLALAVTVPPILIMLFASIYFYKTSLSAIKPRISYFNVHLIKELFNLGIKFFIINIQVLVMYQSTNILISNISTPTDVTTYNIAYKYLGTLLMILNIILTPIWPAFTDAYAKQDYSWMVSTYKRLVKLYKYVFLLAITMILVSPIVYKIWIGSKTQIPLSMTIGIGIYIIINSWLAIQINLINGIGALKLQTIVTTIGMFLHIPLSIILGQYTGALGVVISMTFLSLIYGIIFTKQIHMILENKASGIWIS